MAYNKYATIRYQALDKCFSNWGRKYFIEDLIEECEQAIYEFTGVPDGIKRRQLFEDIKFMESEQGFGIDLLREREGKRVYYRYNDKNFSINNSPLNKTELAYLTNATSILQRFDGAPGFEWVGELSSLLKDQFGLQDNDNKVMSFESNIDYTGYKYITSIFNAIVNKRLLKINYQPFDKNASQFIFHPYHLKQYNNRWFVFGKNETTSVKQWNIPLDRIIALKEIDGYYEENDTNWEDYFSDFIGVTKTSEDIVEVKLLFTKQQASYILTKPIHQSQKNNLLESGELEIRIKVIPNYELETKILSFGEKVKVLAPKTLKNNIINRLNEAIKSY